MNSNIEMSQNHHDVKALVISPTFNEAQNIAKLMKDLTNLGLDILIVDDSSNDGTLEILKAEFKLNSKLNIIIRPGKLGLGSAYIEGFKWGIKRGYRLLIQMDADGSHRISDLSEMLELSSFDSKLQMCIGSRWVDHGEVENWPKRREWLSRAANRYIQIMLKFPVKDSTSGFRIYSADLLKSINLDSIQSEGYSFQIEMTKTALEKEATWQEIPIKFIERQNGKSKMSFKIIREALIKVTLWRFTR